MTGAVLWYLNRATGITVAGAHDADRRPRHRRAPARPAARACRGSPSPGLHRNVGLLSALLLVTHVGTAVVDSYVDIGVLARLRAVRRRGTGRSRSGSAPSPSTCSCW